MEETSVSQEERADVERSFVETLPLETWNSLNACRWTRVTRRRLQVDPSGSSMVKTDAEDAPEKYNEDMMHTVSLKLPSHSNHRISLFWITNINKMIKVDNITHEMLTGNSPDCYQTLALILVLIYWMITFISPVRLRSVLFLNFFGLHA